MSASGNYWLFVQVDLNNVLFQINPSEKISAPVAGTFTATPVDLAPVALLAPTNTLATGVNPVMQVVWAVTNQGTATASGGWYDRVWFSTNGILDGQSRSLGNIYISQVVTPGGIYRQTNNVTLPMSTNGNYWLFVQADVNNSMFEARLDDKISAPLAGTLTLVGTNAVLSNGSFTCQRGTGVQWQCHYFGRIDQCRHGPAGGWESEALRMRGRCAATDKPSGSVGRYPGGRLD
jgi:hypothetical protein